ncbi:MAG: ABC transporter permease [Anaerolineae bacterium]|nr:ABC transporter permease [Anaerolineae bacterium]
MADASITRLNAEALAPQVSEWRRAWRSLLKARWPILGLVILGIMAFLSVFGPAIAPRDPNRQTLVERLLPPMQTDAEGQVKYPLGTDGMGRDLLSRMIYGARISLLVGFAAVAIGGLLGITLGIVAGFLGGYVDDIIMRVADIQLAFHFILLTIMVLVVLGAGIGNLVIVLGVGQWVTYARIARGQTISIRAKEYVEAARSMGATSREIIWRAILPNIMSPLIVIASFNVASVILAEASLSYLGLGVPEDIPTWGKILAESRDQLLAGKWWLAVFPGIAIMLTVLSLNILGDWLRDFLDPRLRGSRS